jgi:membrane associated rhomboid family serine protease
MGTEGNADVVIPYNAIDTNDAEAIVPWTNIGLIVLNFLVFFYELAVGATGGDDALSSFVQNYALVPCEYTARCAVAAGTPVPLWITLFTSMFLHGGWSHILGNMVYLFVFGNHVERSMGHVRYLAFYLLCGLGASALEIATAVDSNLPGLGASGAIAGVLGGFLVLYPTSRIGTLIPLGFLVFPARIYAWVFIAFWFVLQLFSGIASLSTDAAAAGGVAYWAHVGGFLTGVLLIRPFTVPDRVRQLQSYHTRFAQS